MKKVRLAAVILYGVSAILWVIRSVLDFVTKAYDDALVLFILNIICALVWTAGFFIHLHRYRSDKKEQ